MIKGSLLCTEKEEKMLIEGRKDWKYRRYQFMETSLKTLHCNLL